MQSPPGGNQNGNGFPPGAGGGWPPPPAQPQSPWGSSAQPAQPQSPWGQTAQPQPAPPHSPWGPPASGQGTPFRPSANDPYQAYGQIHAQPLPPAPNPADGVGKQVLKNPRLMGLGMLALGLILGGVNFWKLESEGRYYIKAMVLTPCVLLYGLFLLVVGQPIDQATGMPRMWWRVGSGITIFGGLALGFVAMSWVGC